MLVLAKKTYVSDLVEYAKHVSERLPTGFENEASFLNERIGYIHSRISMSRGMIVWVDGRLLYELKWTVIRAIGHIGDSPHEVRSLGFIKYVRVVDLLTVIMVLGVFALTPVQMRFASTIATIAVAICLGWVWKRRDTQLK